MSLKINYNVSAMIANNSLKLNDGKLSTALERLSSGYKINSAKDDAAGLADGKRRGDFAVGEVDLQPLGGVFGFDDTDGDDMAGDALNGLVGFLVDDLSAADDELAHGFLCPGYIPLGLRFSWKVKVCLPVTQ